jgi:hypothetical protein
MAEPAMNFDLQVVANWITGLKPEYIWLGLNSRPRQVQLSEPSPEKLRVLVQRLDAEVGLRFKDMRALMVR